MAAGSLGGLFAPHIRQSFCSRLRCSDLRPTKPIIGQADKVMDEVYFPLDTDNNKAGLKGSLTDSIEDMAESSVSFASLASISSIEDGNSSGTEEDEAEEKSYETELIAAMCYASCSFLLMVPIMFDQKETPSHAFAWTLVAFIIYEVLVGIYLPCEGVLRTMYMPNHSICSLMTILRVIVNLAVAFGASLTNFVS